MSHNIVLKKMHAARIFQCGLHGTLFTNTKSVQVLLHDGSI